MKLIIHLVFTFTSIIICFGDFATAKDIKLQWTDPKTASKEDPDFNIQGEYGLLTNKSDYAIQVIAMGNGNFDAYLLEGGLPGLGWKNGNSRQLLEGKRNGKNVDFIQPGGTIIGYINNNKFTIILANGQKYQLTKIERKSPTLNANAPEGALVLFDGSCIDHWEDGKMINDNLLAAGCRSKKNFTNYKLHLEFRTPYMPHARGQKRGNSGIYHCGRWETQILDSFGLKARDNQTGGVYSICKPLLNMCLPPLTWQTYDIDFKAAQFDSENKRITWPKITVQLNGVTIHENLELTKKSTPSALITGPLDNTGGPLYLQHHNDPVAFRNIWILTHN